MSAEGQYGKAGKSPAIQSAASRAGQAATRGGVHNYNSTAAISAIATPVRHNVTAAFCCWATWTTHGEISAALPTVPPPHLAREQGQAGAPAK